MPQDQVTTTTKAKLIALKPPQGGGEATPLDAEMDLEVQFNPETLKVSFENQVNPPQGQATGADNASATQAVGRGTTKLQVQLWFDVSGAMSEPLKGTANGDVRRLTKKIADLMKPNEKVGDSAAPPMVRFLWGSFQFDGMLVSMEESLEFFSPEGKPLRASVSLSLTQQEVRVDFNKAAPASAGNRPQTPAPSGSSLQALAEQQGKGKEWKAIAAANGIENPRQLKPGQLIDMNAGMRG